MNDNYKYGNLIAKLMREKITDREAWQLIGVYFLLEA